MPVPAGTNAVSLNAQRAASGALRCKSGSWLAHKARPTSNANPSAVVTCWSASSLLARTSACTRCVGRARPRAVSGAHLGHDTLRFARRSVSASVPSLSCFAEPRSPRPPTRARARLSEEMSARFSSARRTTPQLACRNFSASRRPGGPRPGQRRRSQACRAPPAWLRAPWAEIAARRRSGASYR